VLGRLSLVLAILAVAAPGAGEARAWPDWLSPCRVARMCGTFDVPVDPADPAAGTIGLNVVVLPAGDGSVVPAGALVPIAGGPGGASTLMADWADATFSSVTPRRDVVLVDQRGTGRSRPLFCPLPNLVSSSSSPEEVRAYWLACLRETTFDPRRLTTAAAVDDLDALRAELGYERLDLYGVSYGATVVQYFLLRHGDRARTAILDGGTLLDVPVFERWARVNQTMLDRLFQRCARQTACRRAFPSPGRDLRDVLARLDRAPARYRGRTIRRDDVANTIQQLSRRPETAAHIPSILRRAARDGVTSIVPAVAALVPELNPRPQVMSWAIQCSEPWARFDPAETARLGRSTYLGPTMVRMARSAEAVCSTLPPFEPVAGADRRVSSDVPMLVVVGGQDPQDPLENVAGVRDVMPNARVVVVRGAGHGAVNHGCAEDLANAFVLSGSADGLDARCAARAPLAPFVVP
jgi:pimeloyl-ACP methyl ester carboxylesterase